MRAAALLPLAVLVSACSSTSGPLSKDEYARKAAEIEQRDEPPAVRPFDTAIAYELPREDCVEQVRKLHDALQKIVDDARAVRPPPELAQLHREFVANAQQSVDAVDEAADRAARGELQCGDEMNRVLYGMPSTERAEQVLEELADRGVPLCITTCE